MRVLVACEYSGTVRNAFLNKGHDAWSCDFEPAESFPERHFKCDVTTILNLNWDLMIAHPPCERLCVSGARWKYEKDGWVEEQEQALSLVSALMNAPIHRIAIENPVGIISTKIRKPDQVIQPWMFGHGETKATCLWLKNLPKLFHASKVDLFNDKITHVKERVARVHSLPPSPERKKLRAWKYNKIAEAMAQQWGGLIQHTKVA